MSTVFVASFRRRTYLTLLVSLIALALAMTACGTGATTSPNSGSSANTSVGMSGGLQVVKITEVIAANGGKDQYSFSPATLSVKAGDMVNFINQTDEGHTLMSTPAGGIADGNMISKNETQTVRFLQTGSFTVSSAEHPEATLAVTIGSAAGVLAPLTQVKIMEIVASNGGKDQYTFEPASITVNNDTLVFMNQTDEPHTLMGNVDGGLADGTIVSKNEVQIIHFSKDGTYTISSKEHPDAKLTVVVK